MNHDEILQAAKEAGYDWVFPSMPLEKLERFAAIIEKRTIERCVTVIGSIYYNHIGEQFGEVRYGIHYCSEAIRKLGEQ